MQKQSITISQVHTKFQQYVNLLYRLPANIKLKETRTVYDINIKLECLYDHIPYMIYETDT